MTFYHFPTPSVVNDWYSNTPDDFIFSVKMNRTITHYRKLRDVDRYVESFVNIMSGFEGKLGPILVQLPPNLPPDNVLLEKFLMALPRSASYAIEFRDRSWLTSRTYDLLERNGVALVLTDLPAPRSDAVVTADLCYIRWHGRSGPGYAYSMEELKVWAGILLDLPVDSVFGYFNNDVGAAAPRNALALQHILGPKGANGNEVSKARR